MNRSGTTWLTNLLCNHPQIAGVQTAEHFGIIESNMFGHFQNMFGALKYDENFEGLLTLWSHTDFFRSAQGDLGELRAACEDSRCYVRLFVALMERYALLQDCPYWVQKVSPLRMHYAGSLLDRAKLVVIQRDCPSTISSAARLLERQGRHEHPGKIAFGYGFQDKLTRQLLRRRDACVVQYDELVQNPTTVMQRICTHVGIPFAPEMLQERFPKNSSFGSDRDRVGLRPRERAAIAIGRLLATCLPVFVLRRMRDRWGVQARRLVTGSFRMSGVQPGPTPSGRPTMG